jgi:hypothetical protein
MEITTKNMRALLINVLLGIAIVAAVFAAIGGGWSFAKYTGILPLKKAKKALVIDKTPITVEHIKAIGELVTATWYDEQVIIVQKLQYDKDSILVKRVKEGEVVKKTVVKVTNNKTTTTEVKLDVLGNLVIIQDAHGRIGINMAKMKPENLVFPKKDGMPVQIKLPALECLDFIMNPTDTEVFSESDGWNLNDLKKAMAPTELAMKTKMQNDKSLFDTARKSAQEVVTQLFRAAGYENVQVLFESDEVLNLPATN